MSRRERRRAAAERVRSRLVSWFLVGLLTEERTVAMERLLGLFSLLGGAFILSPLWSSFGPDTAMSDVPEVVTGLVFLAAGAARLWALGPPVRMLACQRATLIGFGLWAGLTTTFLYAPPRSLLLVFLTSMIAGANLWSWIRLRLLFPEPRT